jgi:hypothetical protein
VSTRARLRSARALWLALAVTVLALMGTPVTASAYVTATGTGSAAATIATLAAPAITGATPGAGTVSLQWSAVTPPGGGSVSYYVTRDGRAAGAGCPSAAAPTTATSCTDTDVPVGAHAYVVTAVWRSWTSTSGSAGATVVSGEVEELVFTTQPGGGATGGTAFPTQPVVTARDASGNPVPGYAGTVTLSIQRATGATGAALSGCTATLRGGVTSFAGCEIDKAAGGYVLSATDGDHTVASAAFAVGVGPAAQLLFTTQPGGGATGGTAFPTQPVVTAVDAGGNTVTSHAATVALSIVSGTGTAGATLGGCSARARQGVTTFDGCKIDKAGTGYVLRASDRALTVDSAAFDVAAGAASRLVVSTQPGGGATGGAAFPTQPVVTAVDASGNVVSGYSGTITLTIQRGGASGATLSGCVGTLSGGVTSFSGCTIDKAGTSYVLRASDRTLTVDSAAFDVAVGPAVQLLFTTQPAGAVANRDFGTQPALTAYDAGGNVATSFALTITLSIASGTGTPGAVLSGCSSSLRSGVTTFRGCRIDRAGTGYALRGSAGSLTATSAAFDVR